MRCVWHRMFANRPRVMSVCRVKSGGGQELCRVSQGVEQGERESSQSEVIFGVKCGKTWLILHQFSRHPFSLIKLAKQNTRCPALTDVLGRRSNRLLPGWPCMRVSRDSGRTELPSKSPLLNRACSLFLDRSSSLDGTLQGPGRGTKRYSQDSPPYSAPLSPKLPKNDRHPLEGEHSVSSQSSSERIQQD